MRWVAGDVETVFARYGHQVAQGIPRLSVPDSQIVVLEFASGTVGYISTSCVLRQGGGLNHMQVLLEDARIDVGRELIIQPEDALAMPAAYDGDDIDGAFIRAVASGDRSHILCDYEEGLKTAAVSIAANQSAASGQAERCWNG
jgi:predicted dehydrogenase